MLLLLWCFIYPFLLKNVNKIFFTIINVSFSIIIIINEY